MLQNFSSFGSFIGPRGDHIPHNRKQEVSNFSALPIQFYENLTPILKPFCGCDTPTSGLFPSPVGGLPWSWSGLLRGWRARNGEGNARRQFRTSYESNPFGFDCSAYVRNVGCGGGISVVGPVDILNRVSFEIILVISYEPWRSDPPRIRNRRACRQNVATP